MGLRGFAMRSDANRGKNRKKSIVGRSEQAFDLQLIALSGLVLSPAYIIIAQLFGIILKLFFEHIACSK